MAKVEINIPDGQVNRVKNALIGLFPIPTVTNEETGEETPEFTENQWAKEKIRRWIVQQVHRYEERMSIQMAREGVLSDDDIAG